MANYFQDIIDKYKGQKTQSNSADLSSKNYTPVSELPKTLKKTSTPVSELPKTLQKEQQYSGNIFQDIVDNFKAVAQKTEIKPQPITEKKKVTPPDILGFGKTILQETAKSGGSIGLTILGKDKLEIDSTSPKWQQNIQEVIFGKEPVKSLQTRIAEGELTIKPYLKKIGAENAALPVSFVGIGLMTALDFTGTGGEKNVLKTLAKSNDVAFISKILKRVGVADDLVLPAAKNISKITDQAEIKTALDKISELQKTTKISDTSTRLTELGRVRDVDRKSPSLLVDTKQEIQKQVTHKLNTPPKRESLSPLAKLDLGSPSSLIYNKPINKAIVETADATGDNPNIVARVVNSLRETKTKILEAVQDSDIRVKQLTEKEGVKITDASDPYLKATLYPGKVGTKIDTLKDEAEIIIKSMDRIAKEAGSDLPAIKKEVSDFLYFRHAPERNLALGEKAAGITSKEAQEGLKAIENSARGIKVKKIADQLQKINDQTLDVLKDGGVITEDLYKTLREKYKYHIPLNRIFDETDDIGQVLSGKGFDVKSTGIKAAKGSEREVADIMTNILTNHEQAILRAEKNIVDQATLKFVRENEDILGDLMKETHPKAIGKTFKEDTILERTQDPTILQMFENGKRVWIKIKDQNLAIALRGVGNAKLGFLLDKIARFTRFYSGLATRFNPEFFLPNKIRDLQETAVYLASRKDIGFKGAAKAITRDSVSVNDVLSALRGKNTAGAKLYKEMKELGGTTGGMGLSTRKQIELNLEGLERLAKSKTRQIGSKLVEYIDHWNTIFEDSTRLSVYKTALDNGLSKERAAFLAKEASINFNRKGTGGPVINALWMFSNASIQGSAKMIRSLNPLTPQGLKILGATAIAVGGSVAGVNEWNDKVDPEWRDKVSKWDRLNGLPVVLPSTDDEFRYFTIPVSWGLKPIKVMSDYIYDALSGQDFDAKDMVINSLASILDAYNPVGGTDLLSAVMPTALDIPVDIGRNKSWNGNKIKPTSDPNAPADIQYFQSLGDTKIGQGMISISKTLQEKSGIAISPADLKYAIDQLISGTGRTIGKFTNLIASATDDEPLPLDEYPLISRFYRERSGEEIREGSSSETEELKEILQKQSRERFTVKQQAQELYDEFSSLPPDEANAKTKQLKKDNPELYEKLKDVFNEKKLGLTYEEKLMKQLGVENGERSEYIVEQIMKLPNPAERSAYYKELKQKKIVTDEVEKQIKKIRK